MAQAQGVAHLVGRDKADEVSHEVVAVLEGAGAGVDGGSLDLVPVVDQGHHIVIPADVAFQDFTAAGVVHIGAIGIGNGGSQVADDGETGVLQAHPQLLGILRPFLGMDGVLPSGLLEGLLPVVHTGDEVLAPLLGRSGVNVVNNGLDGFHQLSPLLLLNVFGTGFQAPAGDEADAFHALLVVGEHAVSIGEETYAGVKITLLHGRLREKNHGGVQDHGHGTGLTACGQGCGAGGAGTCAGTAGGLVIAVSLGNGDLRIDGIGADALDEAGISLETTQVVLALGRGTEGKHLGVSLKEAVHLDAGGTGIAILLRLEGGHDGILGAHLHGLLNDLVLVGIDIQDIGPEKEIAVDGFLPVEHGFVHFLTAIHAGTGGIAHIPGDGQETAAQQAVGDFHVPVLLVLGHGEEALGKVQLDRGGFLFGLLLGSILVGAGARPAGGLGEGVQAQGQGRRQ